MNQRFLDQTYYEILEIEPQSPEHEIHRAYLKAKETYSPDSPALYTMFSPDEARELSRLIEEAYAVLSNHKARREYDSRLTGRSAPSNVQKVNTTHTAAPAPTKMSIVKNNDGVAPEGMAKTKHGTYRINKDFEKEYAHADQFSGEFLKKIRDYKCISLEAMSEEIRVSKTYLTAVEKCDQSALPADVFVRGFVVQYAKALGLDGNNVANSYMKILRDGRKK
jgi:curved DNA-binding protein CbpA